ncbi:hypothetical protein [Candidatus Amarolinea dominans]
MSLGLVIDLGSLELISQTYALWDENATNPIHANPVGRFNPRW